MKTFLTFVVAITIAIQIIEAKFEYDCSGKRDGNYPHPTKCTHFVACVGQKWAKEMMCALGQDGQPLHYVQNSGPNPVKSRCDLPQYANCPQKLPGQTCYVCGPEDSNCNPDVIDKYLVDIPLFPSVINARSISSMLFPGFSIMGVREDQSLLSHIDDTNDILHWPWSIYCMTTISKLDGKIQVNRNATWSLDKHLNGKCVDSEIRGISHCFCNDRPGCNDKNGRDLLVMNSFIAIAAIFISMKTLF